MADIIVQNLVNHSISGTDLFNDSESFMQELNEDNLTTTHGGTGIACGIRLREFFDAPPVRESYYWAHT